MSSEFNKIGKQTPFTVPAGFFETLHQNIEESVNREKKKRRRKELVTWTLSAAAAITVMAIVAIAVFKPTATNLSSSSPVLAQNSQPATMSSAATPIEDNGSQDVAATSETTATTASDATTAPYEQYLTNEEINECVAMAECDEFINCTYNYDLY